MDNERSHFPWMSDEEFDRLVTLRDALAGQVRRFELTLVDTVRLCLERQSVNVNHGAWPRAGSYSPGPGFEINPWSRPSETSLGNMPVVLDGGAGMTAPIEPLMEADSTEPPAETPEPADNSNEKPKRKRKET